MEVLVHGGDCLSEACCCLGACSPAYCAADTGHDLGSTDPFGLSATAAADGGVLAAGTGADAVVDTVAGCCTPDTGLAEVDGAAAGAGAAMAHLGAGAEVDYYCPVFLEKDFGADTFAALASAP